MTSFHFALFYIIFALIFSLHGWLSLYMTFFPFGEEGYLRKIGKANRKNKYKKSKREGFTILIPCRDEARVIGDTLIKLSRTSYPSGLLEVLVLCTPDDKSTISAAKAVIKQHASLRSYARVVTFKGVPGKSRALNKGLKLARFDRIVIIDAEDDVSAPFFDEVDALFQVEDIDIVQGGIMLANERSRWFGLYNTVEYYLWYKYRLFYMIHLGVTPLGGNTVVFKKADLIKAGGWREDCLTEDAELGIRLTSAGKRVRLLYTSDLVTKEETPNTLGGFIRQRTRWNQGFMQILKSGMIKGVEGRWRRFVLRYSLSAPLFVGLFIVLAPIFILINTLTRISFWAWIPLLVPFFILIVSIIVSCVAFWAFLREQERRVRIHQYIVLIVLFFPYQIILAVAWFRALMRQFKKIVVWEKTAHEGLHRRAG